MKVLVKEYEVEAFWYDGENFLEMTKWLKGMGHIAATLEPDGLTIYFPHWVVRVRPYHFITIELDSRQRIRWFSEAEFYRLHRIPQEAPDVAGAQEPQR